MIDRVVLEYIRTLTAADKKTLSQKALKATEEVGELAKVVLPFDNAFATTHRFVEKQRILEEAVDTILCSMSIGYELGFTDDDISTMMMEKAKKWHWLQARENRVQWPVPFEIHVTVDGGFPDKFRNACAEIGVKPILLELHTDDMKTAADLQTSSVFIGDNRGAYEEMKRISYRLSEMGYWVVREKIETVPWHPAAPHRQVSAKVDLPNGRGVDLVRDDPMPKDCYFECHIATIIGNEQRDKLVEVAGWHGARVSQNVFKKIDDERSKVMVTLRDSKCTYERFEEQRTMLEHVLTNTGFAVEKTITEFSVFDSKISHDAEWIKQ